MACAPTGGIIAPRRPNALAITSNHREIVLLMSPSFGFARIGCAISSGAIRRPPARFVTRTDQWHKVLALDGVFGGTSWITLPGE